VNPQRANEGKIPLYQHRDGLFIITNGGGKYPKAAPGDVRTAGRARARVGVRSALQQGLLRGDHRGRELRGYKLDQVHDVGARRLECDVITGARVSLLRY